MKTETETNDTVPAERERQVAPHPDEVRLLQLKAVAYDTHRQIQFLTQVQLPGIEREIADIGQRMAARSSSNGNHS